MSPLLDVSKSLSAAWFYDTDIVAQVVCLRTMRWNVQCEMELNIHECLAIPHGTCAQG